MSMSRRNAFEEDQLNQNSSPHLPLRTEKFKPLSQILNLCRSSQINTLTGGIMYFKIFNIFMFFPVQTKKVLRKFSFQS